MTVAGIVCVAKGNITSAITDWRKRPHINPSDATGHASRTCPPTATQARIVFVAGQAYKHLYNPGHQYALGPVMLRKNFVIVAVSLAAVMAAIFNLGCTGGSGSQQVESIVSSETVVEPTSVPETVLAPTTSLAAVSGEAQGSETGPAPTIAPEGTPTLTPTPQPTRTPTPTLTPTSQPTRTPTPVLSPADVYSLVGPSVAMVFSSVGTGSAVLLEDGYLVTNHHVVWPDRHVRLLFPDGADLTNVPVVAVDPLADMALLGPVETGATGLRFSKGESFPVGGEVFMVGYPGEVEQSPKPTIVSGVLSRLRRWEQAGITYLQTDASIAGGQSGGAMVDAKGRLLGISGFSFTDAQYALVASSVDVGRIVGRLKRSAETPALGDRVFPEGRGELESIIELADRWDRRDFVLTAPEATTVNFELACEGRAQMYLYDGAGTVVQRDDQDEAYAWKNVALPNRGVYFLQVGQNEGGLVRCRLSSGMRLQLLPDPDDGKVVVKGKVIAGNLDHFRDVDWYSISLKEGETVEVTTDSLNVDTVLRVRCRGCGGDRLAQDDDSGSGLFGTNARVIYRADADGEVVISVEAADGNNGGGYFLSVQPALSGSALTPLSGERVAEVDALTNQVFDCMEGNEDAREDLLAGAEEWLVATGIDRDLAKGMVVLLVRDRATFVSATRDLVVERPSLFDYFLNTWCPESDLEGDDSGPAPERLFRDRFGEGRQFGPITVTMRHDPGDGKMKRAAADVRLDDFLVSATFVNPYSGDAGTWDYGFYLRDDRDLEDGRFGYVAVTSEGKWSLRWRDRASGQTTTVSSGHLGGLDISDGGRNLLEMAVFGDRGLFLLNGQFVAWLDVSDLLESGDVAVVTGIFKGNETLGALTRVRDFEIWSLAKVHQTDTSEVEVRPKGAWQYSSAADALDFLVEAEFVRPSGEDWRLGFLVRAVDSDQFDAVVVNGDNSWRHEWTARADDIEVTEGAVAGEFGDRMDLLLAGFGPVGLLFVDGELVSRLDLSGNLERGEVLLIGDTGDETMGPVQFENFRLWVPG